MESADYHSALAALAWGGPHLVYHIFNTDGLGAGDFAVSLGGLAAFVALPLVLLFSVRPLLEAR